MVATVAGEGRDKYVRSAAVRKLTDQTLLAKIAVSDQAPEVRCAAAEKLEDQTLLTDIIISESNREVRQTGIRKLFGHDTAVRRAAVDQLTNQALLAKVAVDDWDEVMRLKSVIKLHERERLREVAEAGRIGAEYPIACILLFLASPTAQEHLGKTVLSLDLERVSEQYTTADGKPAGQLHAWASTLKLRGTKLRGEISSTANPKFPKTAEFHPDRKSVV